MTMRTELIPAADVRTGDCLLDEQGAPAAIDLTDDPWGADA